MPNVFGKYTAEQLKLADLSGANPLIEEILYERDNSILLGKSKSCKSLLALQLSCSLTSAESLFGQYKVMRPCTVAYLQVEGKLADTKNRLINMTKCVDSNDANLLFLYYPAIQIDSDDGLKLIKSEIDSWKRPDVIIVDCLYMAMRGKLVDADDAKLFVENLRRLSDYYNCTILLVHHTHKTIRTHKGDAIGEGDEAIFGSFVWQAFPEHILMLERVQGYKNYRKLTCGTQRSGGIAEEIDLYLNEPDPLFFEIRMSKDASAEILASMNSKPLTIEEIAVASRREYSATWSCLKKLKTLDKVRIINPDNKPYLFVKT